MRTCLNRGVLLQFRIWWDILQMGLLFYIAFMIPYRVGFNNFGCEQLSLSCMSASSILDLLVEILFVLDVILTFFSSYHSRKTGSVATRLPGKQKRRRRAQGMFDEHFRACTRSQIRGDEKV